jgi:nucleotide-binding universal stress UspA family protein
MTLFQHILVPVDGSKHAAEALKFGLELAKLTKAQVHVLHVIDTASVSQISRLFGKSQAHIQEELRERAMGILVDANTVAREANIEITTHMEEGVPYEAVVDHAQHHGVDLIVIGRVGTRGPRRILIGSMTERVIETAPCHVLVIR